MFAELIRAGELGPALEQAKIQVRQKPASVEARLDLLHALILQESWDKALDQARLAGQLDRKLIESARSYEMLIQAEQQRAAVFTGARRPAPIGPPVDWIAFLAEALRLNAQGENQAAAELRQRAFDEAEVTAGELNGEAFDWIADADQRLGPILEVFRQGEYLWVPWSEVASIQAQPVTCLMDLVWYPATIEWQQGTTATVIIPVRYVTTGSLRVTDGHRLARSSDLLEVDATGLLVGQGQKLICSSQAELALLELRSLRCSGRAGQ